MSRSWRPTSSRTGCTARSCELASPFRSLREPRTFDASTFPQVAWLTGRPSRADIFRDEDLLSQASAHRAQLVRRRRQRPSAGPPRQRGGHALARQAQADLRAPYGHGGPRRRHQCGQGRAEREQGTEQVRLSALRLSGRDHGDPVRRPARDPAGRGRRESHPGHAPEEPSRSPADQEAPRGRRRRASAFGAEARPVGGRRTPALVGAAHHGADEPDGSEAADRFEDAGEGTDRREDTGEEDTGEEDNGEEDDRQEDNGEENDRQEASGDQVRREEADQQEDDREEVRGEETREDGGVICRWP